MFRSKPNRTSTILMLSVALVVIVIAVMMTGCAATIYDKSSVSYVDAAFSPTHLRTHGLALLPVVAGQGQEGYRRPLGDCLAASTEELMGGGHFLGWRETMAALNEQDLSDEYEDLIGTYRETAILRQEAVNELGLALGVRYLLFVSLERFHTSTSTTYNAFTGLNSERTSAVNAFCQVWDTATGNVVWEGAAAARSAGNEFTYDKPYEEYARKAADGLTARLFGVKTEKQDYDHLRRDF